MFSQKELGELRQQMKREVLDLDHQIHELETFYIEDTKQAGNLLKGFDNYISAKTSKIQLGQKKQKVQNYERMFSLSSSTCKTSQILEDSLSGDPISRMDLQASAPKRNRPRQGKTKSGGKNLMREENDEDESSESGEGEGMDDSVDESLGKSRGNKKKKINKAGRKG